MLEDGRLAVVLSSSKDVINIAPVASRLEASGVEVITLNVDEVVTGAQRLIVELASDGSATLVVGDRDFSPPAVSCAWWRKPQWFEIARPDPLTRVSIEREVTSAVEGIAALIPAARWLNSPTALREAAIKPAQHAIAAKSGFAVAPTIATNDWDAVHRLASDGEIVFKSLRGSLQATTGNRISFTRPLDAEALRALASTTTAFPGLYQRRLRPVREWRVTVVGEAVLAAAIECTPGIVDWRRHQLSGDVVFVLRDLPGPWAGACSDVVRRLGLRYGSIDLIEDDGGHMHFLECNPNGQYGWLEQDLGLPVSEAIADELLRIAVTNPRSERDATPFSGSQLAADAEESTIVATQA